MNHVITVNVTKTMEQTNKHPVIPRTLLNFFPVPGQTFDLEIPSGQTICALMGKGTTMHCHIFSQPPGDIQNWWRQVRPKQWDKLNFEEIVPQKRYKLTISRLESISESGSVIAELKVLPLGTPSASLTPYVRAVIEVIKKNKDVTYQVTSMATIVRGPLNKILSLTQELHEVPFKMGISRVVTSVMIDERRDKGITMES